MKVSIRKMTAKIASNEPEPLVSLMGRRKRKLPNSMNITRTNEEQKAYERRGRTGEGGLRQGLCANISSLIGF